MGLQPRPNKVQTNPIELGQNERNQSLAHDLIKVNEISLLSIRVDPINSRYVFH